jgi:hypothetical protein
MSSASDVKSSHFDPGDLIIESILDCPAFRALAGRVTGRHAVQVDSQDGNEFRAAFRAGERDLAVLFFHSPILAPCAAFCAAEPPNLIFQRILPFVFATSCEESIRHRVSSPTFGTISLKRSHPDGAFQDP